MRKVRRFKFLREGLKSHYDEHQWEIGKWHKTECKELCHGFNCSKRIIDAMSYVRGEILAEVEVRGKKFVGNDKSTHAEMRVVKAWEWTKKDSVALAIFSAELVIDIYEKKYPDDDRPRNAIKTAQGRLNNSAAHVVNATDAAHAAAYPERPAAYAAVYAIFAAIDAAADAVTYANVYATDAADAAVYAVRAAATAAVYADATHATTNAAILNKIEKWLLSYIDNLEQIT